jgi:superfamily II DNA/RNA helicase
MFDEGIYKAIVAINVLDEGLDIPSIKMAVILASTGNPKQYIQRRGRILRPFKGKESASLYDILVLPPITCASEEEFLSIEQKIIIKELKRHEEMASIAMNRTEAIPTVENIKRKYAIPEY